MTAPLSPGAKRALISLRHCGVIRIRRATQDSYRELIRAGLARAIKRDPDNLWADIALADHRAPPPARTAASSSPSEAALSSTVPA